MNTQTSRTIQVEHVTLDKADHNIVYELADMHEIVLEAHDELDRCAQCTLPVTGSTTRRTDLLCDYCADAS